MNYKDKFKAQMKKAGINSLDDLKTDAEKKAFFKAVDKSHDAKNEELLTFAEEAINEFKLKDSDIEKLKQGVKQMPPIKGAKLGKPQKVKTADEEYVEEAMKKEMAKEPEDNIPVLMCSLVLLFPKLNTISVVVARPDMKVMFSFSIFSRSRAKDSIATPGPNSLFVLVSSKESTRLKVRLILGILLSSLVSIE